MGTTTTIGPSQSVTAEPCVGDFLEDVMRMAEQIDRRLRTTLTPQQYAMVQDLVLATRISTIARDAFDECAEPTAAA